MEIILIRDKPIFVFQNKLRNISVIRGKPFFKFDKKKFLNEHKFKKPYSGF